MNRLIAAAICCLLMLLVSPVGYAISAEWDLDPISGDWNTAANWMPMGVPNGPADIATFNLSNTTDVSISANTEVNSIIFTSAATNPYTITANPGLTLTISGVGITNNSGIAHNFVTATDGAGNRGQIVFTNSATAGTSTTFTNNGASINGHFGAGTQFLDTSSAGNGTFINEGGAVSGNVIFQGGGFTAFYNSSTAGNGSFTNNGGGRVQVGGQTLFFNTSTGGNGNFINNGGTLPFSGGARTEFYQTSNAGNGTYTNNGATISTPGGTVFNDASSASNGTFTNNGATLSRSGGVHVGGGFTNFLNTSTASHGTFINNGALVDAAGGVTGFQDMSTASDGSFTNNGGVVSGADGGVTFFSGSSTAGNGMFVNNAGTVSGAGAGHTEFFDTTSASNGSFTNNGGIVSGAVGGFTIFRGSSTAASAILVANGGSNGGQGGTIVFADQSTVGTAQIEVFGNGSFDISLHDAPGMTINSIEGDGNVFLGANNLTVGRDNGDTTFSCSIQDGGQGGGVGGSLTKVGTGTLDLTGANTYTGDTNVNAGVLKVDGSITSDTFVRRRSTLAGTGTINANLNNVRGIVSPGGLGVPGALTVVHNYTHAEFATLMIQIAGTSTADFSVLNILGNANLSGYLDPVLLNGFVPTLGDSFTFLNYASLTGEFSHIKHRFFDGLQWSVIYEANHAILTVEQHVPDHGSTFLLLMVGLLGLVAYRRQLLRGQP